MNSLLQSKGGNVRIESLRAFDEEEVETVINQTSERSVSTFHAGTVIRFVFSFHASGEDVDPLSFCISGVLTGGVRPHPSLRVRPHSDPEA